MVPLQSLRDGQLNYINDGANCSPGSNILSQPSCLSTTPLTGPNSLASLDPQGIGADHTLLSLFKSRYPAPNNFSVGDLINTAGFDFVQPAYSRDNTFVGKIDYQVSKNHRLFVRGTWDRSNDNDFVNHNISDFPGDKIPQASIIDHSRSWVVGETWVASSYVTNEASFGETDQLLAFPLNFQPTFPNYVSFFFNGNVIAPPFDGPIAGGVGGLDQQFPTVPVYQARDTFSWVRGKHILQFGGAIKPIIFKSGNLTDFNEYAIGLGGLLNQLNPSLRPANILGNGTSNPATSEWDELFPIALGRFASVAAGYNYNRTGNPMPQGGIPIRDYHSTEYEFFAQDSWSIGSGLTVSYGLRWEFHNHLSEVNGFEAVPNISEFQLLSAREAAAAAGVAGANAAPITSFILGGSANNGPGYYKPEHHDFSPRVGLGYAPAATTGLLGRVFGNRKTSLRSYFGLNYDADLIGQGFELDENSFLFSNTPQINNGSLATDPRFTGFTSLPPIPPPGILPRPFAPNLDANGVPIGFNDGGFPQFFVFNRNYRTPYEMSFSLGVQRELPRNWLVEGSYFGKLGRGLPAIGDAAQTLNFKDATSGQFLYSAFAAGQKQLEAGVHPGNLTPQPWFENQVGAAVGQLVPGLTCPALSNFFFAGTPSFDCTNLAAALAGGAWINGDVSTTLLDLATIHPTENPEQGLLPLNAGLYAQTGAAGYIGNFGSSNYNSLLIRVNHRASRDLTMEFDYAFAHAIDNDSDIQNSLVSFVSTGAAEVCDLRNLRVCRGNSNFDARHTVAANFLYALPFGRGQWVGRNSARWLDEVIGKWKVSGIVIAHTGFPFKIDTGTFPIDFTQSAPAVFVGTQADVAGGIHTVADNGQDTLQYFANPTQALSAFAFPFGGETGNRNVLHGPGYWNTDLALLKDFTMPWSEKQALQFRAEAFNVFNHPNFNPPGGNSILFPGTFGVLNSTVDDPRQVQLALKYTF